MQTKRTDMAFIIGQCSEGEAMDNIFCPFHEWTITEKIGSGKYGTVYRALKARSAYSLPEEAAIKIIHIPSDSASEAYLNDHPDEFDHYVEETLKEIENLSKLRDNSSIVNIREHKIVLDDNGMSCNIYIRMEYLHSLKHWLGNKYSLTGQSVDEETVIKLAKDICIALVNCQKHNIIHRDIKPENIMVNSDGDFKLIDFGIARVADRYCGCMTTAGTRGYMAPEVGRGPYDQRVDIYSLGVVLYERLNRQKKPVDEE